jgi:hypothetical protein
MNYRKYYPYREKKRFSWWHEAKSNSQFIGLIGVLNPKIQTLEAGNQRRWSRKWRKSVTHLNLLTFNKPNKTILYKTINPARMAKDSTHRHIIFPNRTNSIMDMLYERDTQPIGPRLCAPTCWATSSGLILKRSGGEKRGSGMRWKGKY